MNFMIETYGCQMNVADSELVTEILLKSGHNRVLNIEDATLILFNTCCVREHAEKRVLGRIRSMNFWKKKKKLFYIGVIGCMAQKSKEKLLLEKIDFVIGVDKYKKLPQIVANLGGNKKNVQTEFDSNEIYDEIFPKRASNFTAFVTITRGCDNFCSYCIVPFVRGRERSRPIKQILKDIKQALLDGFVDITLLGQNVNSYHYKGINFAKLLHLIDKIEGVRRIRFITSHPKDMSDELIRVMMRSQNVCPHIHVAMQSGNDEILKKMNRKYTSDQYLKMVDNLRKNIPNIAITTDIIVGFPGESEAQYLDTVKMLKKIRFDNAFLYKYSTRTGTKAADFTKQVSEEIKLKRLQEIICLQNEITKEKYQKQIGLVKEVLVEKVSKKSELELMGKTDDFKVVIFRGNSSLIGKFINVKITSAIGWSLKGQVRDTLEKI